MCHRKDKTKDNLPAPNYPDDEMVVSTNDLTGLVQKPPSDEGEMESYAELHHVPVADDIPERRK
ncbi:MAG: hypothetical protein FWE04_04020 [Oscillospiraceae bacterium]|nr:hypothetical protein [Oscillospiraceae bacterium]